MSCPTNVMIIQLSLYSIGVRADYSIRAIGYQVVLLSPQDGLGKQLLAGEIFF